PQLLQERITGSEQIAVVAEGDLEPEVRADNVPERLETEDDHPDDRGYRRRDGGDEEEPGDGAERAASCPRGHFMHECSPFCDRRCGRVRGRCRIPRSRG